MMLFRCSELSLVSHGMFTLSLPVYDAIAAAINFPHLSMLCYFVSSCLVDIVIPPLGMLNLSLSCLEILVSAKLFP